MGGWIEDLINAKEDMTQDGLDLLDQMLCEPLFYSPREESSEVVDDFGNVALPTEKFACRAVLKERVLLDVEKEFGKEKVEFLVLKKQGDCPFLPGGTLHYKNHSFWITEVYEMLENKIWRIKGEGSL